MHSIRFHPDLNYAKKILATDLIDAVLGASDPKRSFTQHFDPNAFTRPTHILAFGKAAVPMTNVAIECLGSNFARATVISTPELCLQTQFKDKFVELLAADHPLPTHRNIDAAISLIAHAKSIPNDHQGLVLISGGGSALLCSPRQFITLEHIIETTDALLRSGAPIQEINAARSKLETLKAGGLASLLEHVAQIDAFVLSDVIGDDLSIIASGPLVDRIPPTINHTIIANNQSALDALCAWTTYENIDLVHTHHDSVGYANDEGRRLARELIDSTHTPPIAVCLGGEPTVDTTGTTGTGGPILELALSCAQELAQTDFRWTIITFATDGIDGPTDAAGAIITNDMMNTPNAKSHVQIALQEHNALPMCDMLGATIRTGPTGTNVNDIALAIRWD